MKEKSETSSKQRLASKCIRFGLAFTFLYAAISSFQNPNAWAGFLPSFLTNTFDADVLLKLFSVYEIGVAVWLLSGWYIRYAGILAVLTLGGVVVFNPGAFFVTFRDVGLAFAALSLVFSEES